MVSAFMMIAAMEIQRLGQPGCYGGVGEGTTGGDTSSGLEGQV